MAEASMVPVKSGNGKAHRAEPFAFLDEFEAEMERFWRRPWFGFWRNRIRGESKAESEVKDEDYYRSERNYRSFYRRMQLPAGVTPEQIQANLNDGVLEVRVPRPTEATSEAKKIEVK